MTTTALDSALMREAIALAWRADYSTSPNPMVGCVVSREGRVIGRGFHRHAGGEHAEVAAVADCGETAVVGGDVHCTLEPCSFHGRTPACADLLVRLRPDRVVIAGLDPNPRVSGTGVALLRGAGIHVDVGVEAEAARGLSEQFAVHVTRGRPFVTLKFAASLDGRIATQSGASRWITGPQMRQHAHRLRHSHDAVVVGVGTVLADDPQLGARPASLRQPRRVVLDSALRTPCAARLLQAALQPPLILCADDASAERRRCLEEAGAEVVTVGRDPAGRADLAECLAELARRDIISVLVEGGSAVLGAFFDGGVVDRVVAHLAPRLIGGVGATSAISRWLVSNGGL